MFVNEGVLARGAEQGSLFVFVHCQRTGGSNMQRWFRRIFPDETVFSARTTGDGYTPWHQLNDFRLLDGKRMVAGFTFYVPHELGRPVVPLANVRHPFYRIVSLYRMSRKAKNHFLHELAQVSDLGGYYRQASRNKPDYFHNLQCARIANNANADDAIEAMHRYFGLVGTTNRLTESAAKLVQTYGWTVDPIQAAPSPPDEINYAEDAKSEVYDEIMANNAEDAKLYDYVVGRGATSERR